MHKSFLSLFSFTILLTNLLACSNDEFPWRKIDEQASQDAESLSENAHQSYLQCYPLEYQNKKECIQELGDQHIKSEYKNNPQYQRSFQYRAEKLGFLKFLKEHNLPCSSIDHGPKFIATENAYRVDCTCGSSYQMQFDYDSKRWSLKE